MKPLKLIVILFLLILVSPDTFAHCKGKHATNPPDGHCDVEPPPAEKYPLYDVVIGTVGSALRGEGWEWIWNGRQVGSTYAQGRVFPLDMTYIRSEFGELGAGCFPSPEVRFGGFFRKAKKSTANGMFWFWGKTSDGRDDVLYLLKIDGTFSTETSDYGFPGNDRIMHMTDWELKVENQGAEVAGRSCEDSGEFPSVEVNFYLSDQPDGE